MSIAPNPNPYPMGTSPAHKALADAYQKLRVAQIEVEETLDKYIWPEDEVKKIDKAVTVMKVAFKGIKKVLTRQGIIGLKRAILKAA
jgi:hypothetical protein